MALRGILGHPGLELVGLRVTDPAKVGVDAATLCGLPGPTGVLATDDDDALLALGADCLSYFGNGVMRENDAAADMATYLERGVDAVTTSLAGLIHPPSAPPELRGILERATAAGGSTVFATGIEPGFGSDLLPLSVLSAVDDIDQVRISEIGDYSGYAGGDVLRVFFGFGQPATAPVPLFTGSVLVDAWRGVLEVIAEAIGIRFDAVDLVHEVAPAPTDRMTACGLIEAGTIGGVRFAVRGLVGGVPVVVVEHVNRMGDDVAPDWPRPLEAGRLAYRVEVDGRPNLHCELSFDQALTAAGSSAGEGPAAGEDQGLIATAMRAVNAIPFVHDSSPGLLSALDLPVLAGRHVTARA